MKSAGAFDAEVMVDRVTPGGPAARAGLLRGDQILAINGQAVERSSVLMESLARHYAGDSVILKIRRGTEEMTPTVELVESLPPVSQGYLGLLPIRPAAQAAASDAPADATEKDADKQTGRSEDGQKQPLDIPQVKPPGILQKIAGVMKDGSDSVPLIVVNDSPMAAKNLPAAIEVLSLNDADTTSLTELAIAVAELVPGAMARIEYRVPGETQMQSAEITVASRPESVMKLSAGVLEQIRQSRPLSIAKDAAAGAADTAGDPAGKAALQAVANSVSRREISFEERGRCVVLSSADSGPVMPGVMILLSADHDERRRYRAYSGDLY